MSTTKINKLKELTNPDAPVAQQVKETFYPQTHAKAVYVDDAGNTLDNALAKITEDAQEIIDDGKEEIEGIIDAGEASMTGILANAAIRTDIDQTTGQGALTPTEQLRALNNLGIEGKYDDVITSGVYDVTANNNNAKFASLSALLNDEHLSDFIPTTVRKGGMSIKFVLSSDNKYVQYRLMTDSWSINTNDWSFCGDDVLIENPEWIYVLLDAEKRILAGLKSDGSVEWSIGIPAPVKSYIDNAIAEIKNGTESIGLDGLNKIIAFLSEFSTSDTLKNLLDTKVDKEEGKSLIDADYASSQSTQDNPEFLDVTLDADDKVLEGIQTNGTKVIGGNLNIGGSASISRNIKVLGDMEVSEVSYKVIENTEYLAAWLDAENKVIFGLKVDGKTYVGDADFLNDIKDNQEAIVEIKNTLDTIGAKVDSLDIDALLSIAVTESPEHIEAKTDSEGKLLAGRTTDGAAFENVGFTTPKIYIGGHTIENIKDPEGRSEIITDSEGRIVSYRDSNGIIHENVGTVTESLTTNHLNLSTSGMTEFQQALINSGFNPHNVMDWSDQAYIHIPQKPTCAVINITGIDNLPQEKGINSHAWMEVWDKNGNYFKKRVILDAQGRSSLQQAKKNFAADFCEDEWEGDATTTIKIGKWVSQDSFHFKAYYTDMFKMANVISYQLWENFKSTMPITEDRPYKDYYAGDYSAITGDISDLNQNANDAARCAPDGFPVMVYLNGEFYGLFSWQLKKHRDNYMLDRNATDNIHLDGEDYTGMFNGTVNWSKLEIRNPKPKKSKWTMYCMDGSKYDGDNPKELIDSTSASWDGENVSHVKSAQVKDNILAMSQYMSEIAVYEAAYSSASSEDKPAALATLKTEIEKRFAMKWVIDYVILINLEKNGDSIQQNTQWVTWGDIDGTMKWYPCPYDLDASFGIISTTSFKFNNVGYGYIGASSTTPIKYAYTYFLPELKSRWAELRTAKIVDKDTFINILKEWIDCIGYDNLKMEYDKWSESPCNRDAAISNKWEITNDKYISYGDNDSWYAQGTWSADAMTKYNHRCYKSLQNANSGHRPDISPEWWEDVTVKAGTYAIGDAIYDGYNNFYKFTAKESITVAEDISNTNRQDHLLNTPFTKLYSSYPNESGVHDSIYRIYKWISEQIALMDSAYTYNV